MAKPVKDIYTRLLTDVQIIPILSISVMGTFGVGLIAPVLPAIAQGIGVSDTQVGVLVSAYTLPLALLAPFAGTLSDLFGRRKVVLPSLFVFGVAGVGITLTNSFTVILLLRIVQGAAGASIMPVSVTLIGDYYTGETSSAAQGLRSGGNGVSGVILPIAASILASAAWSSPFLLYAAAFPTLVLAYIYLPHVISEPRDEPQFRTTLRRYARDIRTEAKNPHVAVLLAGGGMRDFSKYALITFVPLFAVRSLGASFVAAGTLLSVRGLAYIFIAPFTGVAVAKLSRKRSMLGALALSTCSIALIATADSLLLLAALVGVYSVGDALFAPVLKDSLTMAVATEHRGGIVSGLTVGKNLAKSVSPMFFGATLAFAGFPSLFVGAGIALGLYALTVAWIY